MQVTRRYISLETEAKLVGHERHAALQPIKEAAKKGYPRWPQPRVIPLDGTLSDLIADIGGQPPTAVHHFSPAIPLTRRLSVISAAPVPA